MINSVRNTVLAVLNKQNFGYVSPMDFNLYSKQAQLDIFEDVFYRYNRWTQMQNARQSGSDYADVLKNITEVIDTFSESVSLSEVATNTPVSFDVPSDYYMITNLYSNSKIIERIPNGRVEMLLASNLTAPTLSYPGYIQRNAIDDSGNTVNAFIVYPDSIETIRCDYIRKPKDPKWTYSSFSTGEPLFNPDADDYQDFELPKAYEPEIVNRILQYAGVSIRELEVYNYAAGEENINTQKEG